MPIANAYGYYCVKTIIVKNNQKKIVKVGTHFGQTNTMEIDENKIYWIGMSSIIILN